MINPNFILDLSYFFLIYILIFLSISGYGILFSYIIKYEPKNSFDSYLIGIPILTLVGFFFYITLGFFHFFILFFLCLGIFFFF